ncbi:MAG: hypothetical protein CM1200mP41_02250 [Gammaproteobacteria bacterium]|nr:MAG: hypothetical protein CM1200mP41_02250 [Gammaproteobacteria bacterium]
MNTVALESSNIVETYRSKTRESAALLKTLPSVPKWYYA